MAYKIWTVEVLALLAAVLWEHTRLDLAVLQGAYHEDHTVAEAEPTAAWAVTVAETTKWQLLAVVLQHHTGETALLAEEGALWVEDLRPDEGTLVKHANSLVLFQRCSIL